jgi:hypothetical protein
MSTHARDPHHLPSAEFGDFPTRVRTMTPMNKMGASAEHLPAAPLYEFDINDPRFKSSYGILAEVC